MNNKEFLEHFKEMAPMKYYEGDTSSLKGKKMIDNENNEYIAMEKRDGEWCRAIIHEDGVLLQSRSISKVTGTYGDKTELVPHITEELKRLYPAGTVILGELAFISSNTTSKDVGTILRCKAPKAIERQKMNPLYFFPFDLLAYDYNDYAEKGFEERFSKLQEITENNKYIQSILTSENFGDFMEFADWIWQSGGEGIMIVRKDMKYAPGKRTAWQSLKVKKKLGNMTAKVIGFIEPNKVYEGNEKENWKFWITSDGRFVNKEQILQFKIIDGLEPVTKPFFYGWKNGVIVEYEGRVVKVTSGLSDKDRKYFSTPSAGLLVEEGRLYAEITGMELTNDSIRHPVFIKKIIK